LPETELTGRAFAQIIRRIIEGAPDRGAMPKILAVMLAAAALAAFAPPAGAQNLDETFRKVSPFVVVCGARGATSALRESPGSTRRAPVS
jgi:hypothetical protein